MADQVNRLMEAMIPELDDYRRRQLFTPQEIAAIVTQRRTFEYKLARRIPQQPDYLAYIHYELNLNQLRKLRKSKAKAAARQAGAAASHGSSLSDHACLSRICFIFERCLRHFHSSPQLWLHYLHFLATAQSHRRLALTLPRAHLLLPHSAVLWLAHAQHAFVTEADMGALRAVMQRAVRVMRGREGEEAVWLGWFGYEVGFIAKVMERKRVLGINVRESKKGDFDIRYKAGGTIAAQQATDAGDEGEGERQAEGKKGLDEMVLTVVLPTLIYTNATTAPSDTLPSDRQYLLSRKKRKRGLPPPPPPPNARRPHASLPFHLALLSLVPDARNPRYDPRGLPSHAVRRLVAAMREHEHAVYVARVQWTPLLRRMYDGLQREFGRRADVLPLLAEWARRSDETGSPIEAEAAGWAVYETGVECSVRGVFTAYVRYLMQRLDEPGLTNTVVRKLTDILEGLVKRCEYLAQPVPEEAELPLVLSEAFVRLGGKEAAVRTLAAASKQQRSLTMWQQLARLTDNVQERAAVWQEGVAAAADNDKHTLLMGHLNELVCSAEQSDFQRVCQAFQSAFTLSNHPSLTTAYLDYLTATLLSRPSPPSPTELRNLLTPLPLTAPSSLTALAWCEQQGVDDSGLVRRLWEGVVSEQGRDVSVWRRWMAWERAQGDAAAANRLRWRAGKVLGSSSDLQQLDYH